MYLLDQTGTSIQQTELVGQWRVTVQPLQTVDVDHQIGLNGWRDPAEGTTRRLNLPSLKSSRHLRRPQEERQFFQAERVSQNFLRLLRFSIAFCKNPPGAGRAPGAGQSSACLPAWALSGGGAIPSFWSVVARHSSAA